MASPLFLLHTGLAASTAWSAPTRTFRLSPEAVFPKRAKHTSPEDDVIKVNPDEQYGTWEGWGVSLCWWANLFGKHEDLADLAFTLKPSVCVEGLEPCLPGLGLNIARYNAGGSSWHPYQGQRMVSSPNIHEWKQIQGFWSNWGSRDPSSSSWDWTVDANQVAMLKKARARGANHLELFSNSPMWWMLDNHDPSGNGGRDNLMTWNYGNHSYYLATIAAYARAHWGVDFTSVEPLNEPIASWWVWNGTQEGCHFDHSTQAMTLKHLRDELRVQGLGAVVSGSDENTYDQARATWASFHADTKQAIGKVNVHGYQGAGGRRDLLYRDVAAEGKRLWNSEYGDGDVSGRSMASNMNLDFTWLHNTAWVYWQLADEADGWGLLKFDSSKVQLQRPNTKLWVLAQYSRHIRPGMLILGSGDANSTTVAAYDGARGMLVLVVVNFDSEPVALNYDLSAFRGVSGPIVQWTTEFADGGDRYVESAGPELAGARVAVQLPANCIRTLEVANVDAAMPAVWT